MSVDNAELVKKACAGKTPGQRKVIEYFIKEEGCCGEKNLTDDEYMRLLKSKLNSLNLREMALSKIGLDEDEVSEIPPVLFQGFVFKNAYAKRRANGNWVSSSYQVAWLFFSSTQVYVYRHTFNMDENKKNESTDEFFYKDVTSFSTSSETEIAYGNNGGKLEIETNKFFMVVPGDKLDISMDGVEDSDSIIQAMKQKLREKKM